MPFPSSRAGKFAVFYHSYSHAAILYEVQAAVGAVLFRFKSESASLPRMLFKPFEHIPNAKRMLEEWPKWPDKDHNDAFQHVGLCAVSSCLASDSEAPVLGSFLKGYHIGDGVFLDKLLPDILVSSGVPKGKSLEVSKSIISLAVKHGLDTSRFSGLGGKACPSGRAGHYLQIFVRRDLVDRYVYPSHPMGRPDENRFSMPDSKGGSSKPFRQHLERGDVEIKGQVRITINPDAFFWARCVRMFTYSADKKFAAQRVAFQKDVTNALASILNVRSAFAFL